MMEYGKINYKEHKCILHALGARSREGGGGRADGQRRRPERGAAG
jgi:hypothetical protein